MLKIACQTITFGDEMNINHMDEVMKKVSSAGFTGIEIGFRRFDLKKPKYYQELLKKNNLELVAIHIGGDFLDAESVKKQMQSIPDVINLANSLECRHIFLSGSYGQVKAKEDFAREAENYNTIGKILKKSNIALCYHNHDWEIKDDALGLRTLYEYTDPDFISFVPDVGWITEGGADPAALLKEIYPRVKNVHFKEFTADGGFAELGGGIVDFFGVYKVIKDKKDFWVVAEQDQSTIGAEQSIKINYKYINGLAG